VILPPTRATGCSASRPARRCFEPAGCERCGGTGYRGRLGVFECLEMTEPVRTLISSDPIPA